MQARAILFGYEGGLVDHEGPRFEVLAAVLAEEGIDLPAGLLETHPFGPPYEGWLAAVLGRLRGASEAALAQRLMVRAAARYRSLLSERGPAWRAGAVEFVERAAAAGLALGAVTQLPKSEVAQALAGAGLASRLAVLVGAEDLENADSRAAAYRLALERLNSQPPLPARLIHPHEVAAIEGTADGVRAAAEAGLLAIAIGGGGIERVGAARVVGGFGELEPASLG